MKWLAITETDPKPNRLVIFREIENNDTGVMQFGVKGCPSFPTKLEPIPHEMGCFVSRYGNIEGTFFILRGVQKENFNNLIEFKIALWGSGKKHQFCYLDEEDLEEKNETV